MNYKIRMCVWLLLCSGLCLAAEKPYYILDGYKNEERPIFSIMNVVIGLLDKYERHEINGFEVSYDWDGKYFEPHYGPNWWEYFFEPIKVMHNKPKEVIHVPNYKKTVLSSQVVFEMPVQRKHELIKKYIHIHPVVQNQLDDFIDTHMKNCIIIGVDYFSFGNVLNDPDVTFDTMAVRARACIATLPLGQEYKIVISTNAESFLSYMHAEFGDKVLCLGLLAPKMRSDLEDAHVMLFNCLIFAQAHTLIASGSFLSKTAIAFNPAVRLIQLDKHWAEKE